MDTKNILPRITASIHCPVIKLEKILFARFHTCARYLTGFSGNIAYIAFFTCCISFSFCKRTQQANTKPMDTFIAVVRSPMVMDTVEETMLLTPFFSTPSTESIIFPGSMSRDCAHFTTSGLFPNTLSIHFWKTGIFSSIFFAMFTNVAPSSGTTTSITITIIQITKQIESTRLTGLASFCAVFFSCFKAFPNR